MIPFEHHRINPIQHFRHSFILKALLCYTLVQIVFLFFINLPFTSDSLAYYEQASDCITHNTFYPASHNLYDSYIVAPIYINFLSLVLRIYHHPLAVRIFNIVLNLLQALLIYAITRLLFQNERQSKIAVLLYMAFLTNLGIIFYNYSELLFGALFLFSFYLYLKDTPVSALISGAILALACNTRPVGLALFISILIMGIVAFIHDKRSASKALLVLGTCLFTLFVIGGITKLHMGYFVPLPTNGSCNILIGANDDANGSFTDRVFQPGKTGYLDHPDSLTFFKKEQICRDAAFKWIVQHPWRWAALVPAKLFHLFGRDDWAIPALLNTDRWNCYTIAKLFFKEHRSQDIFTGESTTFIIAFITLFVLHHLYYYTLLGMMTYQYWYYKKHFLSFIISRNRAMYLFVIVGIFMTLCSVGEPRYQYSFIIFLLPTIAPMIDNIIREKNIF